MTALADDRVLAHIGIPTEDLEASRKFYLDLGFQTLEEANPPGGVPVIFMGLGNAVLEIYQEKAAGRPGAIDHIALETKDLEHVWQRMEELGYPVLEGGIQTLDFGTRKASYFTIQGPNREKIEFCRSAE